jgi:hypothetical protein
MTHPPNMADAEARYYRQPDALVRTALGPLASDGAPTSSPGGLSLTRIVEAEDHAQRPG